MYRTPALCGRSSFWGLQKIRLADPALMGIRHRAGGAASESILTWNRAAVGLECQACKGKAAMHGRSIRIFLATGEVSGVRHAEVVNWTGQAVIAPRRRLAELRGWAEVQRPGVYVLVGESLETGRRQVYVGEAENVATRLADHHRTKDWWETVLVVTSKDANLTKSHVRYLESRMTALAREAGVRRRWHGRIERLSAAITTESQHSRYARFPGR